MSNPTSNAPLGQTSYFTTTEAAAAEVQSGTEATEALALTVAAEDANWEYAAAAEDNGTVGALDTEPGVVYKGDGTQPAVVSFKGIDISAGTIAPEATDEVTVAIYKNSSLVTYADEGFVNELDTATHEMNGSVLVDAVTTGDVIRVVLEAGDATTEAIDVDVDVTGNVTIR